MIVARAFISASENPICGNHQKGKVFKAHMLEIYNDFIAEQEEKDKAMLDQSSQSTQEEYARKGVGKEDLYAERTPDLLYYRFKTILAPDVMKFMGIHETTEMASGWTEDMHTTACLKFYKKRYGRPLEFYAVFDYLCSKNKFSTFRTRAEEELLGKRPIGKKKARQFELDAKLVKTVLSEVLVKKCGEDHGVVSSMDSENGGSRVGAMGDAIQSISSVLKNVGAALMENMKAEQEMRLVQSIDTPDRKDFARKQMALRMADAEEQPDCIVGGR
jgi:hypothetical protein